MQKSACPSQFAVPATLSARITDLDNSSKLPIPEEVGARVEHAGTSPITNAEITNAESDATTHGDLKLPGLGPTSVSDSSGIVNVVVPGDQDACLEAASDSMAIPLGPASASQEVCIGDDDGGFADGPPVASSNATDVASGDDHLSGFADGAPSDSAGAQDDVEDDFGAFTDAPTSSPSPSKEQTAADDDDDFGGFAEAGNDEVMPARVPL